MTYQRAKERRDALQTAVSEASATLQAFPSGPMGLTPDHIKATPEWREARRVYAEAFAALRAFNAGFVKRYAADIREDRRNREAERKTCL